MSQNSSSHKQTNSPSVRPSAEKPARRWSFLVWLPLWTFVSFGLASLIVAGVLLMIVKTSSVLEGANQIVISTVVAAFTYILTLLIVLGAPWLVRRIKPSRQELGINRLPGWMDIGLAPAGLVVYMIASALLVYVFNKYVPGFEIDQAQDVGFSDLTRGYEYVLAFATLVVLAPLAEELLFRGYLYGKLRRAVPIWVAILVTSALFGAVHGQWNVAIDTFALSVVMCLLRETSGSIWAGVLLHMLKNGIAFYFLFINPSILNTIGG